MNKPRTIVITAALPYANGDIHLGHLVEHCIVDFWARFQKMNGHSCLQICADDTHGTPIMVSARKQGLTPEQLITKAREDHLRDFKAFEIEYDHYSSTHSPTNRALAEHIYGEMVSKGHVATRSLDQLFCDHDKMFLPDRLVIGTCPRCGAEDQYGDACDKCSATYSPTESIRQTTHLFS